MAGLNRRTIFVKGLGNLQAREVSPTPDDAFVSLGHIESVKMSDTHSMVDVTNDRGELVDWKSSGNKVTLDTVALQTDKEQIDFRRLAAAKYHAVRYFGLTAPTYFQYFCIEVGRIQPGGDLEFKQGLRKFPMMIKGLDQPDLGFSIRPFHFVEARGPLSIDSCNLWIVPRNGDNTETAKILDVSGFGRHGLVSSDFTTIWMLDGTLGIYLLRLDGVNDQVSFGDECDIDDVSDFMIEAWIRVMGADASLQEILSKKSADADEAGYRIVRTTGNKIAFKISDGMTSATATGAGNVLTTTKHHVAVAGDRNGNVQLYLDGVADGAAVSIAGVTGSAANAENLILGKLAAGFGQLDFADVRIHLYGADELPANIAAIVADHYAAEKGYLGL